MAHPLLPTADDERGFQFLVVGILHPPPHETEPMADQDPTTADGAEAAASGTSLRERVGRERFRKNVRDGLAVKLKKAAKPKAGFKESEVSDLVRWVSDADIDREANNALTAGAEAEPEAVPGEGTEAEGGAEAKGPIRDWFAANPELVKLVIDRLFKLLLGL